MKPKRIITICASASHYKQVIAMQEQLRDLNFQVKIPKTANIMKRNNNFDVQFYKTWYTDKNDYHKKTKLMKEHFKKIHDADAILVTNFEKNGLAGYIGGNVLIEMVIAFHYKKPIFVYNMIDDALSIKEEVFGLQPVFLHGDLQLMKRFLKIKRK